MIQNTIDQRPRKKSTRYAIYDAILENIQYCKWKPGMPISEISLADMFHVSRTPVREALFLLSQNGFVDIYPQSGSYVSKIDLKRIREIQYLRFHVETPILMELAEKKPPIPESLERTLLLEEFAAQKGNWAECVQLDYSIHEELMILADHQEIWTLIRPELPHYTRIRFFESNYTEFQGDAPRTLEEHKWILNCIASGDTNGLKDALVSHYNHLIAINQNYQSDSISQYRLKYIQQYPEFFKNVEALYGDVKIRPVDVSP